ncbi:MAG TPA: VOC family protein [Candidatus Acidoferrales bacterium]|nr:VOC family protein [Candidatus Acidoferrales bacterium]
MRLNSHLQFNGQCAEAFSFYAKCLSGQIGMMLTYADTPMASDVAPAFRTKIVHATLSIGDQILQGADTTPDRYQRPAGVSLSVEIEDPVEAERVFRALLEKATVQMPIQETFWAQKFGMLTDQFGVPWMINCGKQQS